MQKKLLVAALGTLISLPVFAEDASPFTANVGFTTDYTFRGISQNYRTPAMQGGFDYANPNGLYIGTWASNVSGNQYSNASMEWDLYGGYNGKVSDDFSYNVGLASAFYPGGKTAATEPSKKWDTTELQFGGTYMGVNVAYHYSLTNWYGVSSEAGGFAPTMILNNVVSATSTANGGAANLNSKGSGYLEANYTYTFAGDVALALHAGRQKIKNFDLLSYTDYKIGISKPVGGFTLGAAYTSTNTSDNTLTHVIAPVSDAGGNKKLGGGILALSVSRSF